MNEALKLDAQVKALAKTYLQSEAQILSTLMEMKERKIFPELNYSGIFDYCLRALSFSRAQSYYFQSVAQKSMEVPEIKAAVLDGQLTLSQARRIVPVVTSQNKTEWIAKAQHLGQERLEREVAAHNPKAKIRESIKPLTLDLSKMTVSIDEETKNNLVVLKDLLATKFSRHASLAEVVKWISQECREKFDPERKAARVEMRKKIGEKKGKEPRRRTAEAQSRIKSNEGMEHKPSRFLGNTKSVEQNQNFHADTRHPIRSSLKHKVIQAQGYQCHHKSPEGGRCEQRRWLHYHHLRPISEGGTNDPDNLVLLCSQHHRWIHCLSRNRQHSDPQYRLGRKRESRNLARLQILKGSRCPSLSTAELKRPSLWRPSLD